MQHADNNFPDVIRILRTYTTHFTTHPHACHDVTAKSRHPLEKGDPCLFNHLKRMDFTHSLTWPAFAGMTLEVFRDYLQ